MSHPDGIVVVGGGLAGVSVCASLRSRGYAGTLSLIEASGLPYDRPPLSKDFLLGKRDATAIRLHPASWYAEQSIDLRLGTRAVKVQTDQGRLTGVELADGTTVHGSRVVLACGGAARRPALPGADDPRVHYLRTLADAEVLRGAVVPGRRILIVGGGLIGAEVASAASQLGADVTLADPILPLSGALGVPLAQWLHGLHRAHGVRLLERGVIGFEPTPGGLRVLFDDGSAADTELVLVGIGMTPVTELAERAGAHVTRGIVVGEDQQTSVEGLYAVGDCARTSRDGVLRPPNEHWEAATTDAARAAAALLGEALPAAKAPWWWSDRYEHHLEVVGDLQAGHKLVRGTLGEPPFTIFAVAGPEVGSGSAGGSGSVADSGSAARFVPESEPAGSDTRGEAAHVNGAEVRVLGVAAVNDSASVRAGRRLIERAAPVDPARLSDPDQDLRALVRGR